MKIKITESQFNYLLLEQLTGPTMNTSSGTYVGTTSGQHDFQSPAAIKEKKMKLPIAVPGSTTSNPTPIQTLVFFFPTGPDPCGVFRLRIDMFSLFSSLDYFSSYKGYIADFRWCSCKWNRVSAITIRSLTHHKTHFVCSTIQIPQITT